MDRRRPKRPRCGCRAVVPVLSALEGTRENPIPISDDENDEENSSVNLVGLTTGDCRICYQSEDALDANPIIKVGCQCQGDNSNGHEACLVKWFKNKLLTSLSLECELCKGRLGAHLQSVLLAKSLPEDRNPGFIPVPYVLVLLQVPVEDLDELEVPINTPTFDKLPLCTKLAIEELFEIQKEKYDDGEKKRMLDDTAFHVPTEVDLGHVAQLHEQFIDMVRVIQLRRNGDIAFFPRGGSGGSDMDLKIVLHGLEVQGEILRVPIPSNAHALVVEELLEDLTRHVSLLLPNSDEVFFILPRCMILGNVSTDVATLPSHRQFTYGRYELVFLFGLP